MRRWSYFFLLAVVACAGSIPSVTDDSLRTAVVQWPQIRRSDLERGRELYITKCSGCHSLFAPAMLSDGEWKRELDEMATRARLTPIELERIHQYLYSEAKDQRP